MAGSKRPGRKKLVRLFERSRHKKIGQPPGTPVHLGVQQEFKPWIDLLQYKEDSFNEHPKVEAKSLSSRLKADHVNWINIEGIHDVNLIQAVSGVLDLHPLTQEDIVNTALRPQFESYPGYFFFSLKMIHLGNDKSLLQEQVSLIMKGNTVATFQESPGDVFGRIRDRIRSQSGKIRSRESDYLIYILLDSIVDGYYQLVDHLGERIDKLEDELRFGPRDPHLAKIFEIRREILFLRKNIMPVRDMLSKIQIERSVFQENTRVYLKDLSDHIVQVVESLTLSMEMSGVLIETYHSMQNQRLNAVIKTLTMISTVFLPLNFIAGIYGMNFRHMPELAWQFGYPVTLGLMALVAILMLSFFIQKGWLWEHRTRRRALWAMFASEQAGEKEEQASDS